MWRASCVLLSFPSVHFTSFQTAKQLSAFHVLVLVHFHRVWAHNLLGMESFGTDNTNKVAKLKHPF
jgi:hypothetical protein